MPDLESLGSIPLAACGVLLLGVAAWSLGGRVVEALQGIGPRRDATLWLRVTAGLTIVAWLGVVLGQLGLLPGARSVWLLMLCAASGLPFCWRFWWLRRGRLRRISSRGANGKVWLTVLAGGLAAVTLGPALCPPTGWDELVYHHELPRRWLADGRPAFYADLAYSGFPSLGEVLFWLAGPVEGVIAPRLIAWSCWLIGLALLQNLLRRNVFPGSALVLTLVFASSSAVLMISANCYVEAILLMHCAAILHVILVPRRLPGGGRMPAAVLLGVLAGGAAAVKLTGVVVVLVPCLWYLFVGARGRELKPLGSLVMMLAIAAVVAGPFYLRPWLATGNPCYPYFAEWFTRNAAQLEVSRYHHALGNAAFGSRGVWGLLAAPLQLAYSGERFDGSFGIQSLGLIALAALAGVGGARRCRLPRLAWLYGSLLLLYGFWFATAQQARFLIPAALVLVVLAAHGLKRLRGAHRSVALLALAAAALISLPWPTVGFYAGSWFTALGLVSRTAYVHEMTDRRYVPLVQAIGEHVPADGRALLLFEHRGFYVPRGRVVGTPFFQVAGFTPAEAFDDPDRITEVLRREGVTHVVMTSGPAGPDWAPEWSARLSPFLAALERAVEGGGLQTVWESERYRLLSVTKQ